MAWAIKTRFKKVRGTAEVARSAIKIFVRLTRIGAPAATTSNANTAGATANAATIRSSINASANANYQT